MPDEYCLGKTVEYTENEETKELEKHLRVFGCKHPAWKMLIVGIPGVYGDFRWECTKCGKVLQGRNPFKDESNSEN